MYGDADVVVENRCPPILLVYFLQFISIDKLWASKILFIFPTYIFPFIFFVFYDLFCFNSNKKANCNLCGASPPHPHQYFPFSLIMVRDAAWPYSPTHSSQSALELPSIHLPPLLSALCFLFPTILAHNYFWDTCNLSHPSISKKKNSQESISIIAITITYFHTNISLFVFFCFSLIFLPFIN